MVLRFDRVAFGLLALVVVMSSAQQQARADEPVVLTEQEILAQIVGNTAVSTGGGERWSEYYQPDGAIRGRSEHGTMQGKWTVSGSEMCFVYVKSGDVGCWTISVKGNEITYSRKGEHSMTGTLLKGNPNNH